MATPFKPAGYSSVSPYLISQDGEATLAFLEAALGAQRLRRHEDEAGRIRHAEARIDDSVVMIADSFPGWEPTPSYVHVYVKDVDAAFAKAKAAGGKVVQEPVQKDDDDKRGGITGPGGITWWLSTQKGPRG